MTTVRRIEGQTTPSVHPAYRRYAGVCIALSLLLPWHRFDDGSILRGWGIFVSSWLAPNGWTLLRGLLLLGSVALSVVLGPRSRRVSPDVSIAWRW